MISNTAYLTIPKEKAERIILSEISELDVLEKSDNRILIGKWGNHGQKIERVILEDYQFKRVEVETDKGSSETGVLGSKVEYAKKSLGRQARDSVSQYIETG
jgi:hypothetical protein